MGGSGWGVVWCRVRIKRCRCHRVGAAEKGYCIKIWRAGSFVTILRCHAAPDKRRDARQKFAERYQQAGVNVAIRALYDRPRRP